MAAEEPNAKKARMDEIPEHLSGIAEEAKKALIDIDHVQNEIDALNEKASDEILKVEQKYNKLRAPHYEKRKDMIKEIKGFWSTAILNHPQLTGTAFDIHSESIIPHIKNVEVVECEDIKSGYKIIFEFEDNEYFENDKIVKEMHLGEFPSTTTSTFKWKDPKWKNEIVSAAAGNGSFAQWLVENEMPDGDDIGEIMKDDLWPNPLQYYLVPTIDDMDGIDEDDDDLEEVDDDYDERNGGGDEA